MQYLKLDQAANAYAMAARHVIGKRGILSMLVSALFMGSAVVISGHTNSAFALSLGEPTLRSFLGESLDVSLPLMESAENENVDTNCFALQRVAGDETYLHGREIKLSVAEIRGSKRLRIQSLGPVSEPVVKLRMRATCGGGAVVRDYALLLDPAPQAPGNITPPSVVIAPIAVAVAPVKPNTAVAADRSPGVWVAREGDSMKGIASGLFPKSKRNQGRYVSALRNTNPSIAGYAASAPLPPGTNIALPDLRSLPQNAQRTPPLALPDKPVNRASSGTTSVQNKSAIAVDPALAKPKRTPSEMRADKAAKLNLTKPQTTKPSGFSLKLSGGDVDTSRSAGVTEETRAGMRQKQLLLDADDQVAALLTLSNSVKRLEKRLDAMQGRPAGSTQAENTALNASALPSTASAVSAAADPKTEVSVPFITPSPTTNIVGASTPASNPAAAPAAPVTATAPASDPKNTKIADAKSPRTSAAAATSIADDFIADWPLWLVGGAIALGLVALLQINRRRKAIKPTYRIEENTLLRPNSGNNAAFDADSADAHANANDVPAGIGAGQIASFEARRHSAEALMKRATPALGGTDAATGVATKDDADVAFDLDPKPARSSTASHSRGLNSPENRVRRLKYMAERFPELGSGTVSIDDSVSVINAARLYYDEKQADKAIELLTFGVEERPQQLPLWLALFEVYRLENMAEPFTELATKFHVLFAASPEWPKVRHIGYELNPYEHLFADAVEGVLMGESPFDSMQDNWLNAPVDMSSHFFAQQLRQSLFAEFNVLPNQLDFSPNVIETAAS